MPENQRNLNPTFAMSELYDNIGNRKQFTQDSETTSYSANELNQYSAITNNGNPVVTAFDADGNMITNGGWTYSWNGENRMISASNGSTVVSYAYDYMGRCFSKVKNGSETRYIWDGYNIIAELSSGTTNYNVWGLDLSQSLQGAGGVGGLLAVVQNGTAYYPCFDGNGNVCDYVDGSGTVVAHREYSPFGKTAAYSGSVEFTHWWSTKPWDGDTGLVEYPYRKYIVDLARWGSRDPIGEDGGVNLYGFVGNEPVAVFDPKGLLSVSAEITSYHGSVEWHKGAKSGSYFHTDSRGAGSYHEKYAMIDSGTVGAVTAWMDSATRLKGYWRNPDSLQLSGFLYGKLIICDCCCEDGVQVDYRISVSMTASGKVGGGNATSATFDGDTVMIKSNSPAQSKTGSKTYDCPSPPACLEIPFDVGSGWLDYDSVGSGVVSSAKVTALARCVSGE